MRRAAWCAKAAEMHTGKSVSRCLCSVIDLPWPDTRISEPTALNARTLTSPCKTRLATTAIDCERSLKNSKMARETMAGLQERLGGVGYD